MAPNLVFFDGRTAKQDDVVQGTSFFEVVVYTPVALGITAVLAGVTAYPGRGIVQVESHDCSGAPSAGVSLGVSTSDRATTIAYFSAGGAALAPGAKATDATGVAIAFGVPDSGFGVREALGTRAVGGALAFSRAGAVSSVVALP